MGLPRPALRLSRAPFHRIVSGTAATPVEQISLPMMFGTCENNRTECMRFEGANFEMTYNAFPGRPTLANFMVIHHYAYLVLKMLGPNGVILIKGDIKEAYDCDLESCETADALLAFVELQNLKKVMLELKTLRMSIQPEDKLNKTI
jgi:hypothetical protein